MRVRNPLHWPLTNAFRSALMSLLVAHQRYLVPQALTHLTCSGLQLEQIAMDPSPILSIIEECGNSIHENVAGDGRAKKDEYQFQGRR